MPKNKAKQNTKAKKNAALGHPQTDLVKEEVREKLKDFLKTTRFFDGANQVDQADIPSKEEDVSAFLTGLVEQRVRGLCSSKAVRLLVELVHAARRNYSASSSALVKRVSQQLISSAYLTIWRSITAKAIGAQDDGHDLQEKSKATEGMETLLKCLSGEEKQDGTTMTREMWFNFLSSLDTTNKAISAMRKTRLTQSFVMCTEQDALKEMLLKVPSVVYEDLSRMLVQMYVDVSALNGLEIFSEIFITQKVRSDITKLLLFLWECMESQHALQQQFPEVLLTNFLGAVLEEIALFVQRLDDITQENADSRTSGENKAEKVVSKLQKSVPLTDQRAQLNATITLLCRLVSQAHVAVYFTRPPLSYQLVVTLSRVIDDTIAFSDHTYNKPQIWDLAKLIFDVADKDSEEERGFLWTLANQPDAFALYQCLDLMVHSLKSTDDEDGYVDKIEGITKKVTLLNAKAHGRPNRVWKIEDNQGKSYDDVLGKLRFTTASLVESHSFRAILEEYDPDSEKIRTLSNEMEHLQKTLPVLPGGAIFVVRDSERCDVLRCVVSGSEKTAYWCGLFTFDIYCPDGYPRCPPLVRFLTTGYGTADFHACLGANGEVFLTLLGTGSSDDRSQAWDPDSSSISQVLEAIKTLMKDNQPILGYQASRKALVTKLEEIGKTIEHNSLVVRATVQHAMMQPLRHPLPGLEWIVRRHFTLQGAAIHKHCTQWTQRKELAGTRGYCLKWDSDALNIELETLCRKSEKGLQGLEDL